MWSMVQLVSVQLSEVCPELRRAFAEEGTVVVSNRIGYCVVSSSNHAWTTLPLGATFQMCEFDLCEVGGLKDPENGLAMRKRLVVVTTSPAMFQALHGRTCRKQHAHQVIEGQTLVDGQLVRRSVFSEVYPRNATPMAISVELRTDCTLPVPSGGTYPGVKSRG